MNSDDEEQGGLPLFFGSLSLASLANQHSEIIAEIQSLDALRLAASFGGLLTDPALQANCLRLEALVHLSLALGKGTRKPTPKIISSLFSTLGTGPAGWMEDPAEDVFVSNISTPRGNFRVFEGIWESSGFHTQRVLNALEMTPNKSPYAEMRNCVYALLKLSDAVCARAHLTRNMSGQSEPQETLPKTDRETLGSRRRIIRFNDKQLQDIGIELDDLAEFGFDPSRRSDLINDTIGHSELERYPLAYRNGELYLLLPTAVSAAIRRFIIEKMEAMDLSQAFTGSIAIEYSNLFSKMPLLGQNSGAPLEFRETENGLLSGVTSKADEGFFVNLVFVCDTLKGFEDGGLVGALPEAASEKLSEDIENWIDHAFEAVRKTNGYRGGLSIVVACGVGRGFRQPNLKKQRENWRTEFISAADLVTLSYLDGFTTLSLLRILEGRDRLKEMGIDLENMNGLLNIVAWARMLGGHLVPHADMPEEFGTGVGHNFIVIEQNGLLALRQEVTQNVDEHVCKDTTGRWLRVFKEGASLFKEDNDRPYYICIEAESRWPRGVYETEKRTWWIEFETTDETRGRFAHHRHEMLRTWMRLAAPILDEAFDQSLPPILLWKVRFEGNVGDHPDAGLDTTPSFEETLSQIDLNAYGTTLTMVLTEEFENSLQVPENIGERALVTRLVEGVALLAGVAISDGNKNDLTRKIVTGPDARQTHAFRARRFRDFVHSSVWPSPVKIDPDDAATLKLGLGWNVRNRAEGGDIQGKLACTEYLNSVVKLLQENVCEELRQLDRESVISFALLNHESATVDRDRWRKTSRAVIALHSDKDAARQTIIDHEFELNAVFHASRLLIEFAICECPTVGGMKAGRRDMSRIMASILTLSGLGGWSDAIHWDAMEPRITIRPLGDIHANVSFQQDVLAPYSREAAELKVTESIDAYPEHFSAEKVVSSSKKRSSDDEFWEAFEEQFGAHIDTARKFIDALENYGIQNGQAIFRLKRSELLEIRFEEEKLDSDQIAKLLDFLIFKGRPDWRNIPDGFNAKDVFPWRYRRALTVLRRPLIQLHEDHEDPSIIVAPGLVRDAFSHMVGNYYKGDFPRWQLKPKMNRWAGKARDQIGSQFTADVAARLEEHGWRTQSEIAVTKLLRKGFDRNYGDIDVLAWKPETGRVLLIECKDLQYRKTDGEVAEQLADYRGQLRKDGKPDDLLKHLNRIDLILDNTEDVKRYLELSDEPSIEGYLVFRNPVPMRYAWEHISKKIRFSLYSDLVEL